MRGLVCLVAIGCGGVPPEAADAPAERGAGDALGIRPVRSMAEECGPLLDDGQWPAEWTACASDYDCTDVQNQRCACEFGWAEIPVNRRYAQCVPYVPHAAMCTDVDACDHDGPSCVDGVCVRGDEAPE
jgi:hypothetical protein